MVPPDDRVTRRETPVPRPSLKAALVDAAEEEFRANGYTATGVATITARASAPKGSFYNHFSSKEELAGVVLDRYAEGRRIGILSDEGRSPLTRIHGHFEHLREDLERSEFSQGCLFGAFAAEITDANRALRSRVRGAFDAWRSALACAIGQAKAAGEVADSVDPVSAADLLVDAWEGAALRARASGTSAPIDNIMTTALRLILPPPDASPGDGPG